MTVQTERRLAAIMFADIVGYTALMQRSEAHAVESRDRFRSVLRSAMERHGGEVVQHFGDGTLCVFSSAVAAVDCAFDVQQVVHSSAVPLRIGLHVGDVVRDAEGVYGHGVNVAARVQALAPPGAVLLTERVAEEVANHDMPLVDLGRRRLKNVERPVGVYAISREGVVVPAPEDIGVEAPVGSVAVLPFANMSPDPDQRFFADGITDEVINALAQVDWLKVTSRTSSFAFRDTESDIREIARTLDVGHVLEGSVRRSGGRIRVTAQLVDAESGFHLFSKTWDSDATDIFAVEDQIAAAIAERLAEAIGPDRALEAETVASLTPERARSVDPEAYRLYLEARSHWHEWSPEGALRSISLYRKSLEADRTLAASWSGIATSFMFLGIIGRIRPTEAYGEARKMAHRALEADPRSSEAEAALGMAALFYEWDRDKADNHLRRALALSPGSADVHHYYGIACTILERPGAALAALEVAHELDPLSPSISSSLAEALAMSGQIEEALSRVRHTLELAPGFRSVMELEAHIHLAAGNPEQALAAIHRYRAHAPSPFAGAALLGYLQFRAGDYTGAMEQHQRLEERERVEPDTALDLDFALLYLGMRKVDWALRRLEKAVETRAAGVAYLSVIPIWSELADHPRFKAIRERIGLWPTP